MPIRRDVPSGRGALSASVAVACAALGGGLGMGVIGGMLHRWFSLLLLSPLLIGLVAGLAAAWMVRRHKLRAPVLALLLGAAGGAAGYLIVHAVDYARYRVVLADALRAQAPETGEAEIRAAVDTAILHLGGHPGIRGYLDMAAREGVVVKRSASYDKRIAFMGTWAWAVWLIELSIAMGLAGLLPWAAARVRPSRPGG